MKTPKKPLSTLQIVAFGTLLLCVMPLGLGLAILSLGQSAGKGAQTGREDQVCRERLRKVAQGLNLYADQNNDLLPPGAVWVDVTWPLVETKDPAEMVESAFRCPVVSATRSGEYGYALNGAKAGRARAEVRDPEGPLVYDSANLSRNATGEVQYPRPHRHHGHSNLVRLDGSIGRVGF